MSDRAWSRSGFVALLAGLALASGGCGPAMSTVSGNVMVDGKPLEKGTIAYVPAESSGTPAQTEIVGGKYELQMNAGKKFVQISAPIVVGKRKEYEGPDAPLVELTDESLPPKYNSQTTLTFEVKSGRNEKDWAVESQPRP